MNTLRMKSIFVAASIAAVTVCAAGTPPTVITALPGPVGLSATTTNVLYTHPFCETVAGTRKISTLGGGDFAVLPDQFAGPNQNLTCAENYLATSPGLGGFPAGVTYVFAVVNQGTASEARVILREPGGTVFATLPAGFAPVNHAYVSFDTVGSFGFALLVTGQSGIIGYNSAGGIAFSYTASLPGAYALEGASVMPLNYVGCPGCLFVTVSNPGTNGAILVAAPGASTLSVWTTDAPSEPESIQFVPFQACSFNVNNVGYSYFVSGYNALSPGTSPASAILAYTPAQLAPFAGQLLVPDEFTGIIWAYSGPTTRTVFSNTGYQLEGAQIVQCSPGTGCPATQGYWKFHTFPASMFVGGNFTLGTFSYTATDLVNILETPPKQGNAILILAHQLIAAIANVDAGAQVTPAAATAIAQAELLFINNPTLSFASYLSSSSTLGSQMTTLSNTLDDYNSAVGLNCSEGSGLQ